MTSPLRGPAPHPQGRRSRSQAGAAGEWAGGSRRREQALHPEPGHGERRRASQSDEALRAALAAAGVSRSAVRYRGFVLLPQADLGWLVRPERSPMTVLPFRTPPISLSDVKALVDWRLDGAMPATRLQRPTQL